MTSLYSLSCWTGSLIKLCAPRAPQLMEYAPRAFLAPTLQQQVLTDPSYTPLFLLKSETLRVPGPVCDAGPLICRACTKKRCFMCLQRYC
jgi:hypothetical protein